MFVPQLLFRSTMSWWFGLVVVGDRDDVAVVLLLDQDAVGGVAGRARICYAVLVLWSLPPHLTGPHPSRIPVLPFPDVPLQSMTTLRDEPSSQIPYCPWPAAEAVETVPSLE